MYSLQEILAALETTPKALSRAYFYAFVTFVLHLSFAQVDLFQAWHSRRCYERSRGQVSLSSSIAISIVNSLESQLFCAIHYKALKRCDISEAANAAISGTTYKSGADLGKLVNLMQ